MPVNNPTTRVAVGYMVRLDHKRVFRSAAGFWSADRYHSVQRRWVLVPTEHKSLCVRFWRWCWGAACHQKLSARRPGPCQSSSTCVNESTVTERNKSQLHQSFLTKTVAWLRSWLVGGQKCKRRDQIKQISPGFVLETIQQLKGKKKPLKNYTHHQAGLRLLLCQTTQLVSAQQRPSEAVGRFSHRFQTSRLSERWSQSSKRENRL